MATRKSTPADPAPIDTNALDPGGELLPDDVTVEDHSSEYDVDVHALTQAPEVTAFGDESEG